ncbi:MAG: hypothetical protein A3E80_06005 [Chlamydiae bacterium RIFCSPHIGHO2_12_FULL_49_9]|nr:MAG: hypothetical protein A3E80_06005 [Chlamydiae bacterium RIFCSPHIGHO2_12_FULL_49_9]
MTQFAGLNPWLSMWSQPRSTIRAIVHINPSYGVIYLASMYALQGFLYFSNLWSAGLSLPLYAIVLSALVLSPLVGMAWIYMDAFVLGLTGRWLGGDAMPSHLRSVLAWSKIPFSINLLMWFILLGTNSEAAFILDGGEPSSLFINFITFVVSIWSFVLLTQSLREIQGFSISRSIANIALTKVVLFIFILLLFNLFRFMSLI